MKTAMNLLYILLAACICGGTACAQEFSPARNQYVMEIVLDDAAHSLQISMDLSITNNSPDVWTEICLRDYMQPIQAEACLRTDEPLEFHSGILSAQQDGQAVGFYADEADPSIVYLVPGAPLKPGETATFTIGYAADIPQGTFRCGYEWLEFASAGRCTYELAQFYPMLCVYEDGAWQTGEYIFEGECFYTECADFRITLQLPEIYTVAASGAEERIASENGVSTWQIEAPNMRDVTIIASSEYDVISGEVGGVTVNSYFCKHDPDGSHRRQGEIALQAALDSVRIFEAAYGPYAYGELDVTESSYEYGGMEAPGLVRISQMYSWFISDEDPEADRREYTQKLQGTVAHEVAHEWFYAMVGNDQFGEAWLDESFAAYSEQLYWRGTGRDAAESETVISGFEEAVSAIGGTTVDHSVDELISEYIYDYTSAVYKRGAAFLYRLEQAMGQDRFLDFMRNYFSAHLHGVAHTEDFIAILAPYIRENPDAQALVEKYISRC